MSGERLPEVSACQEHPRDRGMFDTTMIGAFDPEQIVASLSDLMGKSLRHLTTFSPAP